MRELRKQFKKEVEDQATEQKEREREERQRIAENRRLRLELREKRKLETEKLNRERAEKARKMREEKRKVTAAEFEAYQEFRDSRVTEKITCLQKEAENWMSLNKQERDEAIDNAFREGNRTRWDQSMIDLERANSNRATRVVTNTSLRTGYPKWEQGQQ
eukprot:g2898.t1